jgi:DNA integrity scanning protein DisA with diadenylate cyclase activity
MTVNDLIEHEDGSATMEVDMTVEELQVVVEIGLLKLIKDYMDREQNDEPHS